MSKLRSRIAISLDGYTAGPDQSVENPLGVGGMQLARLGLRARRVARAARPRGRRGERQHDRWSRSRSRGSAPRSWAATCSAATRAPGTRRSRGTAGGATTRRSITRSSCSRTTPRAPLALRGRHDLHLRHRRHRGGARAGAAAAGGKDVSLAGGASAAQQYLDAGLVDEMEIHLAPILLGAGERLFDGVARSPRARARAHDRRAWRGASQIRQGLTLRRSAGPTSHMPPASRSGHAASREQALALLGWSGPDFGREPRVRRGLDRPVLHRAAGGVLAEVVVAFPVPRRANRSRNEVAATVGTHVAQDVLDARGAERTLVRADACLERIRRQRLVAVLAGGRARARCLRSRG